MKSHTDASPGCPAVILPTPKRVDALSGMCRVEPHSRLDVRAADPRVERSVRRWLGGIEPTDADGENVTIRVVEDSSDGAREQGYRLIIRPDVIEIVGGSPVG